MSLRGIMRTTLWTQLHEAIMLDYGVELPKHSETNCQEIIDQTVDLLLSYINEQPVGEIMLTNLTHGNSENWAHIPDIDSLPVGTQLFARKPLE